MFKVGDNVHCNDHNKNGIVTTTASTLHSLYPIAVGFIDGSFDYYTANGQIVPDTSEIALSIYPRQ